MFNRVCEREREGESAPRMAIAVSPNARHIPIITVPGIHLTIATALCGIQHVRDPHHSQIVFVLGRRAASKKETVRWGRETAKEREDEGEHSRIAYVNARINLITVNIVYGALGTPQTRQRTTRGHRVVQHALQLASCGLFGGFQAAGRLCKEARKTRREGERETARNQLEL